MVSFYEILLQFPTRQILHKCIYGKWVTGLYQLFLQHAESAETDLNFSAVCSGVMSC